jgi:flavorubredoxin
MICPLHGPVLKEHLDYYIGKYQTWSSYQPEDHGVFIAYASIHGNTKKAANMIADMLREAGEEKVVISDLSREDSAEAVEDAFRYDRMILACASYDGGIFPPMENFLLKLKGKAYQSRKVALIENGSWAPCAAKKMKEYLETMKNVEIMEETVTIPSTVKDETKKKLKEMADKVLSWR